MNLNRKNKTKKNTDKKTVMMQDYRILIEELLTDIEIIENIVKRFSMFSLVELKEYEKFCKQKQQEILGIKEKTNVYVVSKQNPIDLDYISVVLDIILLKSYIELEKNTQKSIEVLKNIVKQSFDLKNVSDENLIELRDVNERKRIFIIAQWLMRQGYFNNVEECEELYDCSTELSLINEEIEIRNQCNQKKYIK